MQGPSRAVVVERKGEVPASDQEHDASDPEAWRPNPLPLPTYVTAPKAVRPIKVIDLTTPGTWSSGRLLEDDVADEDLLAAQVADEELDALIGEEVSAAAETPGDDQSPRRRRLTRFGHTGSARRCYPRLVQLRPAASRGCGAVR